MNCGYGRDASRQIIFGFRAGRSLKGQKSIFSKNGDDSVSFLLKAHHLHSFLQVLILFFHPANPPGADQAVFAHTMMAPASSWEEEA